jgi:hypothetical protein
MKDAPRVYILVSNDLSSEQRMHKTALHLHTLGYDVTLIGRLRHHSEDLQYQPYKTKRIALSAEKGMHMYLSLCWRFFRLLKYEKPTIVISVDVDTILSSTIAKRLGYIKKLIYDSHEYFTEVPELQNKPLKKWTWKFIEKICVPYADECVTVNESLARILGSLHHRIFEYIWNAPLSKEKVRSQKPAYQDKFILYQGAVNEGRGLLEMIAAMPLIDKDLSLWIVGTGDLFDQVRKEAEASPVSERIKIFGFIDPSTLHEFSSSAFLGINLLEERSLNYYYSLANKFFDYIHAGVPSIHMAFPEYEARISEFPVGITIEDLTPSTISKAVNDLYHDSNKYNQIKDACKKAAQIWTWQNEAPKWSSILKKHKTY